MDVSTMTSTHIFNSPSAFDSNNEQKGEGGSSNSGEGGSGSSGSSGSGNSNGNGVPDTPATAIKGRFTDQQVKYVMDILAAEGSYLIDSRIQEIISTINDEDEKQMFRIDAIMSALGVEDREDLDDIVSFFFTDPTSEKPTVHPNDVTRFVRDFVVKRQQTKTKSGSGLQVKTDAVSLEKKQRRKEKERRFWQSLAGVVSDRTFAVWTALEKSERRYTDILEERSKLISETTDLAKQNEELKVLLQEYLSSKINEQLQIPPTHLIRVDNH